MGRLGESQPSRGPDRLTHGTVHAMLSPATADMRCGNAEPATRRMTAREDRAILEHGVSAFGDTRRLGRASLAPPALAPAGRSWRPTSALPWPRSAGEHGNRHEVAPLHARHGAPRSYDMARCWSQPMWTRGNTRDARPCACRRRERGGSPAQYDYRVGALGVARALGPHTLFLRRCPTCSGAAQ